MIWNVHAIIHNNKYFEVGMKWILEINILCEWNVFQNWNLTFDIYGRTSMFTFEFTLGIFDRIHLKRLIISQRPKAVLLQTDGSFLAGFWKTICLWQILYLEIDFFFGMICIIHRLLSNYCIIWCLRI